MAVFCKAPWAYGTYGSTILLRLFSLNEAQKMADDARENDNVAAPAAATATEQPKYPKGVVLDKDGKP